jgi:hypothetical protein
MPYRLADPERPLSLGGRGLLARRRTRGRPASIGNSIGNSIRTEIETKGFRMATPISRRTILAAGAGAVASLALPDVAAQAGGHPGTSVRFILDARVLDGGEQVTSITLNTARLGPIDPASLTTSTFRVHAKAQYR